MIFSIDENKYKRYFLNSNFSVIKYRFLYDIEIFLIFPVYWIMNFFKKYWKIIFQVWVTWKRLMFDCFYICFFLFKWIWKFLFQYNKTFVFSILFISSHNFCWNKFSYHKYHSIFKYILEKLIYNYKKKRFEIIDLSLILHNY